MINRDRAYLDGIAKTLAVGQDRRQVLRLLGGAVLGTALGSKVKAGAEAAIAICKGTGKRCKLGNDYCSGRCKNNRCRCSGFERRCRSNSDCCQGGETAYCDLRCLDPDCDTCAATDQLTGYCKDDSYCGGVRP
jgi:hypothetical protein